MTGSPCNNSGNIVPFDLDKIAWRKNRSGERVFRGKLIDLVVHDKVEDLA